MSCKAAADERRALLKSKVIGNQFATPGKAPLVEKRQQVSETVDAALDFAQTDTDNESDDNDSQEDDNDDQSVEQSYDDNENDEEGS